MNGLILAGGHSRRMGRPKSLIPYHGKPQYQSAADLLRPFCTAVYLSCRAEQASLFEDIPLLFDQAVYGDIGPLNGVLSAFDHDATLPWLIIGCDYPYLDPADLLQLVQARNPACLATVFYHPGSKIPEPLLGIYEPAANLPLRQWLQEGNESLRHFLGGQAVELVAPAFPGRLRSVDSAGG